jgi:uncharacterized protein
VVPIITDRDDMKDVIIDEYIDCISDLLSEEIVWSMDDLPHHADVSCLDHCFNVSFLSFSICKRLGFDYRAAARGGLLHDFFLYDWHGTKWRNVHGIKHPKLALANARRYFEISNKEASIIKKHMWPLTIFPALHKEAYVVMLVDKYCTIMEILRLKTKK